MWVYKPENKIVNEKEDKENGTNCSQLNDSHSSKHLNVDCWTSEVV